MCILLFQKEGRSKTKEWDRIKMKKVEVEWIDAQSSLDCYTLEELKELGEKDLRLTKSCGYLIHKDKLKVVLGFMMFGDDLVKHHQIIPMGMVKRIKEIR